MDFYLVGNVSTVYDREKKKTGTRHTTLTLLLLLFPSLSFDTEKEMK
jgi:hypothetical protein